MSKPLPTVTPRQVANPSTPVSLKSTKQTTVAPKTKKNDTASKVIATLVPGHSVGVRPAPSTADRSGRRPLK